MMILIIDSITKWILLAQKYFKTDQKQPQVAVIDVTQIEVFVLSLIF